MWYTCNANNYKNDIYPTLIFFHVNMWRSVNKEFVLHWRQGVYTREHISQYAGLLTVKEGNLSKQLSGMVSLSQDVPLLRGTVRRVLTYCKHLRSASSLSRGCFENSKRPFQPAQSMHRCLSSLMPPTLIKSALCCTTFHTDNWASKTPCTGLMDNRLVRNSFALTAAKASCDDDDDGWMEID